MSSLELESPMLWIEWWRLWTCHLVHWNASHLFLNLLALLPPMMLVTPPMRWRLAGWALMSAPVLSLTVLAGGFQGEYRGASGLVVGVWVLTGLTLVTDPARRAGGLLLLSFIVPKLVLEVAGAWPTASDAYRTSDVVHYAGALTGVLGAAIAAAKPRLLLLGRAPSLSATHHIRAGHASPQPALAGSD